MSYLFDAELAPLVPGLPSFDLATRGPQHARSVMADVVAARAPLEPAGTVHVENHLIPAAAGHDVPVRVHRPEAAEHDGPALLMIHGGGWIMGDLESEDVAARVATSRLGCVVVTVEYRLSPEHRYPAALEDCLTALTWIAEGSRRLDIDPARVGVSGTSAGGALAAALSLVTRERGGPKIRFLCLDIPMLDDRLSTSSMVAYSDTPVWNTPEAEASWDSYLGPGARGTDSVPPAAAPAREVDLAGLPPTLVMTCQFDPLRDEGLEYARRLLEAGVPTEVVNFAGTFHGSATIRTAAVSQRMETHKFECIRQGLA
jgi:acetyl esterase/lipase